MAKVSIIIPIYNVEKYLDECLNSVINQTLSDIEIVCVNDGSSDQSLDIIKRYAADDSRIIIIDKHNTGYGNSMNLGIKISQGEYIGIVEPDDFVSVHMFEDLYRIAKEYECDFVKSNYYLLEGNPSFYNYMKVNISDDINVYDHIMAQSEKLQLFCGAIAHWSAIYNRKFIIDNDIYFNETAGASYQDTGFWFIATMRANRIYLSSKSYYYYRQDNPNSSMMCKDKIYCIRDEYNYILDYINLKLDDPSECMSIYLKCRFIGHRDTIFRIDNKDRISFIKRMKDDFCEYKKRGMLDFSLFNEYEKKDLEMIMCSPEQYYTEKFSYIDIVNTWTSTKKMFYIYGAGFVAKNIYNDLYENNKKNFCGFIVTSAVSNESSYCGCPLYVFEEIKNKEELYIVVGVSEKHSFEIERTLLNADIRDYLILR